MDSGGRGLWLKTWVASVLSLCSVATVLAGVSSPQVLVVVPQQFMPANSGVQYTLSGGGLGFLCTVRGAGYFMAPVRLPAGARIYRVEAAFDDSAEDAFGVVALFRVGEVVRDLLALTPMSLARPLREVAAVDLNEPEVVRSGFQYWLHLTLTGPDVCLQAVRVHYTQE